MPSRCLIVPLTDQQTSSEGAEDDTGWSHLWCFPLECPQMTFIGHGRVDVSYIVCRLWRSLLSLQ